MDLRSSIACAAGVCLGVAVFYGAAGGSGRLTAAPTPADATGPAGPPAGTLPRTAAVGGPQAPRSADPGEAQPAAAPVAAPPGVEPTPTAPDPARRSRIYNALSGPEASTPGERVVVLAVGTPAAGLPTLPSSGVVLIEAGDAEPDAVAAFVAAVRDRAPGQRVARVGFLPGRDADPAASDRDAAVLASVDLLAVAPPEGRSAGAVERFFDEAGRRGRRVLALVEVPRTPAGLGAWRAAFGGATAAGVGVVLRGEPGGGPATEAAWRADVAAHEALHRRLGGIAYD
ncbi:hypothetical protein [Phycisphaera mikurensis]|uniref:Uncharacterized protein n=1 Tax=Phycisphaera mikurensis (strain NBRC 102666 / KCTC 22515 / FYK2301M01) TaxID=1142394 RepID=I0IFL7_PHYMF|nr:hypothetical protein [Phycisphaera mikurensis]MBB6440553.1 hypothetical protein [Phycisphaera mikurensis]BAM04055.1 hypothetical protein PSMK_18960 [Phycisphaera mikurensis NBRC 102666]